MAQTIIIEQGDELLQDVERTTPDTQVNFNCPDKYPVNYIIDGAYNQKTFIDASETEFTSPSPARTPAGGDEPAPEPDPEDGDGDPEDVDPESLL